MNAPPPINNILYDTNLHKLVTKEDSTHIHKILGIFSLANYIYRYYLLFCYGSMFLHLFSLKTPIFLNVYLSLYFYKSDK